MPFKRITPMDVYEIIRRWHAHQPIHHIAYILNYDRKTVRKYIHHLQSKGLTLDQPLPSKDHMMKLMDDFISTTRRPTTAQTQLEPYLDEITALVNHPQYPLKPKMAFEVICQRHELTDNVSYSSFKRFIHHHHITVFPKHSTCRLEVDPGDEIQIDYAKMGLLYDPISGKRKIVYAFIATLSHSRHKFVEFVYHQDQLSFVASHVHMFDYFDGVAYRITIDNLKTGILKADLYDPRFNYTYREMAEYYGCFIDPCRVRRPQDKGKVERDVQTVRDQFRKMLALHPHLDIHTANQHIKQWCLKVYGQKEHGTTHLKPYVVFIEREQPALKPLPREPFVMAQWKEATVHPDHYIQFNKNYYTVPHAYVGKRVWVRATHTLIQIYDDHQLIKQHAIQPHQHRYTDFADFPPQVKAALDEGLPLKLQQQAKHVGPYFAQLVRQVLQPHAFLNLRRAQGLVRLMDQWDHQLIEQTATVFIHNQMTFHLNDFKRLLELITQQEQPPEPIKLSQQSLEFVRDISYFIHPLSERT